MIADSRRSLRGYPPVSFKMNAAELALFYGSAVQLSADEVREKARALSEHLGKPVFVTMAERGILAARAGSLEVVPALPPRGPIDIVGAGDSVTANLTSALSGGASLRECLEIAQMAASLVIHQLGTTGTATVAQLSELLPQSPFQEGNKA